MLLSFLAVSIVTMAFVYQPFGACVNCTAGNVAIYTCLSQPSQKAVSTEYNNQMAIGKVSAGTAILTELMNQGCINASDWADVQVIQQISTYPAALQEAIENLSESQKTDLQNGMNNPSDPELREKYKAAIDVVLLPEGNKQILHDWVHDSIRACGSGDDDY